MEKISCIDWQKVTEEMNEKGYALVLPLLPGKYCEELISKYDNSNLYRKTITMERHSFGLGEYKYFKYPLPDLIETVRKEIYPKLAPVANTWMKVLNIERLYPNQFDEFQRLCHDNNQTKPTVLILKYGEGGYNTLHQDLYRDIFFPIQVVLFLNEPGYDYTGGEFVLKPCKGDLLLLTTNFRPVKGSKGYYRVQMKHGISEVHDGTRHTLGIIFHDALS